MRVTRWRGRGEGKCGGDYRFRAAQADFLDGSGRYVYSVGGITPGTGNSACGMGSDKGLITFQGIVDAATEVIIAVDNCGNSGDYGTPTINGVALPHRLTGRGQAATRAQADHHRDDLALISIDWVVAGGVPGCGRCGAQCHFCMH